MFRNRGGPRSPMGTMTGDAPQPGETPRTEGNPWSWSDPGTGAWWRGDSGPPRPGPRRADPPTLALPAAAQHTGEAAAAHQAGAEDATTALAPEPEPRPAEMPWPPETAQQAKTARPVETTP